MKRATPPTSAASRPARRPRPPKAQAKASGELPTKLVFQIRHQLLAWYRQGHRDLPWRRTSDPYAVWVSEIMLQQTRVETVKERFVQFIGQFPTVEALAKAPLESVLALWSGLGYYARARNLHAAAREVAATYAGRVPTDPAAVHTLPGVGPYTAGAILSIAFGQSEPILDGNVIRVLARLFAISEPPEGSARKRYWGLSAQLVPPARPRPPGENDPGDFNQALMELGATVCLPQRPLCLVCPLAEQCQGRQDGEPERYPPRKSARPVPVVRMVTVLCRRPAPDGDADQVLLLRRPESGLWGGLWEPATVSVGPEESEAAALDRLLHSQLGITPSLRPQAQPLPPFVHVLTHRELRFAPYQLFLPSDSPLPLRIGDYESSRWVTLGRPLALGLAAWVSALVGRATAPTAEASH
jgi:A/G-specific adenine glycosylase